MCWNRARLIVGHGPPPRLDDVQPAVGHSAHDLPDLLFAVALEKFGEDFGLKDLDEPQLATALHLKALQLGQGPGAFRFHSE